MRNQVLALLWAAVLALRPSAGGAAEPVRPERELAAAYEAQNYDGVAKLLPEIPDSTERRLLAALADVYDPVRQNVVRGQGALLALFRDAAVPAAWRAEAGLALARTAQLMKERRDLYRNQADGYDHQALLREVMGMAPGTAAQRNAFMYLIRERLEDEATRAGAWTELEDFVRDFPGERQLLAPVHLLAEHQYLRLESDYPNAVRHLRAGYELGFANPNENRAALFRLAFLTHRHLNRPAAAAAYYRLYLEKHPYSNLSVVARRFLGEIEAKGVSSPPRAGEDKGEVF